MLIPSRGNMYTFVSHEWRPITGRCPHLCKYCYVTSVQKRYGHTQTPPHLHKSKLKCDLGKGNFIFCCSTFDLFAESVPKDWIIKVLAHCKKYSTNKYLFQTKNPYKMYRLKNLIPANSILATTIESNINYIELSNAPPVSERAYWIGKLSKDFETCVTIEPILSFCIKELILLIKMCNPKWVNIGADSKKTNLPEPSKEKVMQLIEALKKEGIEIREKSNLSRLINN